MSSPEVSFGWNPRHRCFTADYTATYTADYTAAPPTPVTWLPIRSGASAVVDGNDVTDRLEEALVDEDG
jgi:hypothetical protein